MQRKRLIKEFWEMVDRDRIIHLLLEYMNDDQIRDVVSQLKWEQDGCIDDGAPK